MSTEESIKGIVAKVLHCDPKGLTLDTTWKGLKADSLDLVQILVALEDTFGIEISDEAVKGLNSLGDTVTFVESCSAERAA